MKNLSSIVKGAFFCLSLGACATSNTNTYTNTALGCQDDGRLKSCSTFYEGSKVVYFKGSPKGSPVCGATIFSRKWTGLADVGCDGIVDIYQLGGARGEELRVERSSDEAKFKEEYDPLLAEIKDVAWRE